jgi:hypothetical protein
MHNEYPQEFVDSVIKSSPRNRLSSDTIYQVTVIIPYDKGISERFRRIGNRFNLRTIFKTKHTLRGTLTKTGPVRDAQQTKQCVYSIPCDCSRCYSYIGETNKLLEVRIKEHRYNVTQGLLENQISPTGIWIRSQNALEISAGLTDWTKHHIQEIQEIRPHVSDRPSDQSNQLGQLSHLDHRYHRKKQLRPV